MDYDGKQGKIVHFWYTIQYYKNKELIETTVLSKMYNNEKKYDKQLPNYIETNLKIKNYKIVYKELGAIPLFYPSNTNKNKNINIGTAGGMTRLSTGYTFLNIQEHSKYIRENIENISEMNKYEINKKYQYLDEIFLRVIKNHTKIIPDIFFKMFKAPTKTVIKFISNKINFL